ncbi:hypothetical protein MY3296_007510 [Beauveria thailandica]
MAFFAASLLSEIWETSSLSQLSRPGIQGQLHEGDGSDEVAQSIKYRLPHTLDKNIPELTDIDGCRQDSALPELKKPDLALRSTSRRKLKRLTDRRNVVASRKALVSQTLLPAAPDRRLIAQQAVAPPNFRAWRKSTKGIVVRLVQGLELRSRANSILLR